MMQNSTDSKKTEAVATSKALARRQTTSTLGNQDPVAKSKAKSIALVRIMKSQSWKRQRFRILIVSVKIRKLAP